MSFHNNKNRTENTQKGTEQEMCRTQIKNKPQKPYKTFLKKTDMNK